MGMSLTLVENAMICEVENHQVGSNICVGGTGLAECSITYNYFKLFNEGKLDWHKMNGKKAEEVTPHLRDAIAVLHVLAKTDPATNNYWDATAGNAVKILEQIWPWFQQYPNATVELGF